MFSLICQYCNQTNSQVHYILNCDYLLIINSIALIVNKRRLPLYTNYVTHMVYAFCPINHYSPNQRKEKKEKLYLNFVWHLHLQLQQHFNTQYHTIHLLHKIFFNKLYSSGLDNSFQWRIQGGGRGPLISWGIDLYCGFRKNAQGCVYKFKS